MKKLLAALLAASCILASGLSVSAAGTEILKGTPTLDGKLDDIYKQSVMVDSQGAKLNPVSGADVTKASEMRGITYILYDDKYLYMCTTVTDNTLMTRADSYFATGTNFWQNDNVEDYVDFAAAITAVSDPYKIAGDAWGKKLYGGDSIKDGILKATHADKSYVVEIAIPIQGKKAGDAIVYALQINNQIEAEGAKMVYLRTTPTKYTLSSKSVELPKAAETAAASTAKAAATFDMIVPTAALLMAASYVGIRKNKHR